MGRSWEEDLTGTPIPKVAPLTANEEARIREFMNSQHEKPSEPISGKPSGTDPLVEAQIKNLASEAAYTDVKTQELLDTMQQKSQLARLNHWEKRIAVSRQAVALALATGGGFNGSGHYASNGPEGGKSPSCRCPTNTGDW